jgi:hypothetical protein
MVLEVSAQRKVGFIMNARMNLDIFMWLIKELVLEVNGLDVRPNVVIIEILLMNCRKNF